MKSLNTVARRPAVAVFGALVAAFVLSALMVFVALGAELLPALPENAVQIGATPVFCPPFGVLLMKEYDANGNGDFEISEIWAGERHLATIYFDEPTEQTLTHAFVREGPKVVRYARNALMEKYPSPCSILITNPEPQGA